MNNLLSTHDFSFFKDSGIMHAEASALQHYKAGSPLIAIESPETGVVVAFFLSYTAHHEGEVVGWEYKPIYAPDCPRVELVSIYND